jgi:hypothetical protein
MGWNSWECYGTSAREDEVKANADYMAKRLAKYGWEYVVVEIQWYEPQARAGGYRSKAFLTLDEYSRVIPAPNRFPSSAGGASVTSGLSKTWESAKKPLIAACRLMERPFITSRKQVNV